jgi:DNA replication protein DnaC
MNVPDNSPDAMARAAIPMLLTELRLPTMSRLWQDLADQGVEQQWSHPRFLQALAEHEVNERDQRRILARLKNSGLPFGKTLSCFDFKCIPALKKLHIEALCAGQEWVRQAHNVLMFGPSGVGKSHLASAIGHGLIHQGFKVMYARATDLIQQLQAARRDLSLPQMLEKLDRFDCLILDDLGYAKKDQGEAGVLFELISQAYERRSLIITCNQPFKEWDGLFPDKAMTLAAIDRLIHHAIILEMNVPSYRKKSAQANNQKEIDPS